MTKLPASKLVGKTGWKVPKEYLPELATFFEIEHVDNPWDNIGEGLKLEPYCYQKETIKFAVENNKALLILPCGAGKYSFGTFQPVLPTSLLAGSLVIAMK